MSTLTTANSILLLTVAGLYPVPVPISGYAVDDAFDTEEVQSAETVMGVDGNLSAGFTPYAVPLHVNLQADSLSNVIFDAWIGAEQIAKDKYIAGATILIQGTGALYTFKRGFLTRFPPMPGAKKILQPRRFTIEFQEMTKGPI